MRTLLLIATLLLFTNCEKSNTVMEYLCWTLIYSYSEVDTRTNEIIKQGEIMTVKGRAYTEDEILPYIPEPTPTSDTTEYRTIINSLTSSQLSDC
ncbi:MAG TPA: hypothetical protein PLK20_04005 [Paludibacteraceae bacterium]|nr:hypothetical protein [Paludibacteraceae bacterium]HQP80652.1 hypothetical protein [Paludibacteraceae bacterium]